MKFICKFKGHKYELKHIEPDGWGINNWHWKKCKRCGHSTYDTKSINAQYEKTVEWRIHNDRRI